jgi:hypothetical protein
MVTFPTPDMPTLLKLDHLTVLYPGERSYALADRVTVVPFAAAAAGGVGALFPTQREKRR